jgi:hypothetical protein
MLGVWLSAGVAQLALCIQVGRYDAHVAAVLGTQRPLDQRQHMGLAGANWTADDDFDGLAHGRSSRYTKLVRNDDLFRRKCEMKKRFGLMDPISNWDTCAAFFRE